MPNPDERPSGRTTPRQGYRLCRDCGEYKWWREFPRRRAGHKPSAICTDCAKKKGEVA